MSVAKIKAKGKQKPLPKLKAILANPNKKRCPILHEKELEYLKLLLETAIQESKLEPRRFATDKGICLGLESSLRKINNQTSSCVFISLSIKPNHIIRLIARNAENKDETQPIYAQPKLENFIEELFGVQALCMVFPKDLQVISDKINKWVEERKIPSKIRKIDVGVKKNVEKKRRKLKIGKPNEVPLKEKPNAQKVAKDWTGDFISLGKDMCGTDNSKLDGNEAVDALSEIMDKIPKPETTMPKVAQKIVAMEVDNEKVDTVNRTNIMEKAEDSDNCDYFLDQYTALTVHKIKGNSNKPPKKKRKKNKEKKSSK